MKPKKVILWVHKAFWLLPKGCWLTSPFKQSNDYIPVVIRPAPASRKKKGKVKR